LEDFKTEILDFEIVGEFLEEIKKKFRKGNKELVKIAE